MRRPALQSMLAAALVALAGCTGSGAPAPAPEGTTDTHSSSPPPGSELDAGLPGPDEELELPGPPPDPTTDPGPSDPLPTVTVDPLLPGPLAWTKSYYDFGFLVVSDPSLGPYQYPVQVNGSIHAPDDGGPHPLVLLMHGRHGTCSVGGTEIIFVPCANAAVVEPVDSFEGYDAVAQNLASHGHVVVSVNANGVNDRDLLGDAGANARAQLVLHTLDEFARANATGVAGAEPFPTDLAHLQGRIDLGRVGLMGHSRGGEGVARAVTLARDLAAPHGIGAVFALAPTDFGHWALPGVAFATLLPYCDGDVFNLQGAWMYDEARGAGPPRHQVLAMGGNHNFYNTVWTGDDWRATDPWCTSAGRDAAPVQRAHGTALMASFFRHYLGREPGQAAYWDGGAQMPDTACGGPCEGRLHWSREPAGHVAIDRTGMGGEAAGVRRDSCLRTECPGGDHIGSRNVAALAWEGTGRLAYAGSWDAGPGSGLSAISFRAAVPVEGQAPTVLVTLKDAAGASATVPAAAHSASLYAPPGGMAAKSVLSAVRIPLEAFAGVDLASLAVLELSLSGGSQALLYNDLLLVP